MIMSSTDPTALWVCHSIAIALCVARLLLRIGRSQKFMRGDYWTMVALISIILRATLLHVIFDGGYTTTLDDALRPPGMLSDKERNKIIINSKLYPVNRLTVNTLLWALKMVVFDLCARLNSKTSREKWINYTYYTVFAATYLAGQIAVLLECRPYRLYWQIYPDPGACVKGNIWLVTYEIGNLITDTMLVILPFPILLAVKTRWQKKAQLCSLFSIGFFLIAVSVVRIIQSIPSARVQATRTLWGSIETVFATLVAQLPTLYTLMRRDTQSTSSYTANAYRLTSVSNRMSRWKSANHPDHLYSRQDNETTSPENWNSCRAEIYRGDLERPQAEHNGETDSTKGILVTVNVTQVVRTETDQQREQRSEQGD